VLFRSRVAEDTDSICKWLRGFPGLLAVSGPPGQETVVLTVGKIQRTGTSESWEGQANSNCSGASGALGASTARPPVGGHAVSAATSNTNQQFGSTGTLLDPDDDGNPATVQLRGLPFRATIADIRQFLGEHTAGLTTSDPPIRLLLNRDGRPSGFARVQFATPQAAQHCREGLHRKQMGDRYVEVLPCSDRAGKMRHRRAGEADATFTGAFDAGETEYAERERILQECRDHMRMPGRNQLLLSMLGIALSAPARAYLRRANLGLKHFLARLPNEFRVEGPKGCERVIWCGAGSAIDMNLYVEAMQWAMGEPVSPKLESPGMGVPHGGESGGGHCLATPSVWGTPGLDPASSSAAASVGIPEGAAAEMLMNPFGAYPWAGAWNWDSSWNGAEGNGMDMDKGGKNNENRNDKAKRGNRGEVAPTRSHAHLHPQSHPFANRGAATETTTGTSATAPSVGTIEGEAPKGAALRLRGLPFSVTVQDVLAFFAQHDVADKIADGANAAELLPKANGRPSGQAVVLMRTLQDAKQAQQALSKQWIGGRYIEVFVYGEDENQIMDLGDTDALAPPPPVPTRGNAFPGADMLGGLNAAANPWAAVPWMGLPPPPLVGNTGLDSSPDWLAGIAPAWDGSMPMWGGGLPHSGLGGTFGSQGSGGRSAIGDIAAARGLPPGVPRTLPVPSMGLPVDEPARATLQV